MAEFVRNDAFPDLVIASFELPIQPKFIVFSLALMRLTSFPTVAVGDKTFPPMKVWSAGKKLAKAKFRLEESAVGIALERYSLRVETCLNVNTSGETSSLKPPIISTMAITSTATQPVTPPPS
ncbi:uncharacterized protein LACBIDRAFT_333490 [Laccaria bicolor S238N-H82]|uniref:Predicted protein n=1 Tax=Laccaria bicolor (strain S238N-H82 / ATCC MYA-4686) TaxID=486041 RepID=B0DW29_LACBS|nr:uncharacterized protein LACBIDRAFT_333490 [Laccaria bicolor S238N-H82]EDR01241.1 predicted protein [Laccaria bicolor S238N-H82]|eukprot:XP_001888117.1 predicted protein [Laccaria bicolor S238N-H82]